MAHHDVRQNSIRPFRRPLFMESPSEQGGEYLKLWSNPTIACFSRLLPTKTRLRPHFRGLYYGKLTNLMKRNLLLNCLIALALIFTGIQLGVSYAHFMQMYGKLQLPLDAYILVQNQVISYKVKLAFIEIPDFLVTGAVVFFLYGRHPRFFTAFGSLLCLILMWVLWLVYIRPINAQVDAWTVTTAPMDWQDLRLQWHQLHLARLVMAFGAMCGITFTALQPDPA
jgi:hypothetical protein